MRSDMNVCRSYNTVFSNATDSVRKKVVIEVKTVYNLKSATIIQYTIKGRFMSR